MHAQRERHRAAGGGRRRGGGRGPVVGGMFGPGPMAFEVGLELESSGARCGRQRAQRCCAIDSKKGSLSPGVFRELPLLACPPLTTLHRPALPQACPV